MPTHQVNSAIHRLETVFLPATHIGTSTGCSDQPATLRPSNLVVGIEPPRVGVRKTGPIPT
jgi:hypothetical protein